MMKSIALPFAFLLFVNMPLFAGESGLAVPRDAVSQGAANRSTEARNEYNELLSQWRQAGIQVNEDKGNWAEALAGYLGEHAAAEREGRSAEFRKQLLLDYAAVVNSKNALSLREVKSGSKSAAAKAVGFGKGVMVFHMLQQTVGAGPFLEGLRQFIQFNHGRSATWDDIRTALEKTSGKDLRPFFDLWINRKDLPELVPGAAAVRRAGDEFEIQLSAIEAGDWPSLAVPADLKTAGGVSKRVSISLDQSRSTLLSHEEPRMLMIDPDYDIARLPSVQETPALIKTALSAEHPLLVMPVSRLEAYVDVVAKFMEQGAAQTDASRITHEDIQAASAVIVLGRDNPALARLFGSGDALQAGFSVAVRKNPWSERGMIMVVDAGARAEAQAALPLLEDAGAFTAVAWSRGSRVFAHRDGSSKGVIMDLREEPAVLDLSLVRKLPDAIAAATQKRIIYVGEYHDKYEHHAVQLQVVKGLFAQNDKLAIGMEMFQRPFQPVLDDYIAGKIDERTFLKRSEYFKRWVFDYNLYKPILDYARENKIPVVALNQRKEIADKVGSSGLDSLTPEEQKDVPAQMDFSDDEYRERLRTVFGQHRSASERSFDSFYQAQVLWDETMAASIDEFLKKNPDRRMVVIAGSGHIAYGSGIPKRCFRRNGLPYFISLNDGELDKDMADYIILPQPLEGTAAPKLMVMLAEENDQVVVKDLPADSVSKQSGVRIGDVILAIDGEPVQTVEDIRLALFFKKQGDTLKVSVLRKGFLFGEKKLDIPVKL